MIRSVNTPESYCLSLECLIVNSLAHKKFVNIDFTYLEMNKKSISIEQRAEIY